MTDNRLRVTLPARLGDPVNRAAQAAGLDVSSWITSVLDENLGLGDTIDDVPLRCPEPVVIIRLAPRAVDEDRAGWVSEMTIDDWWEAASGWWRIGPKTREQYRFLAAADPHGVVHHLWRIGGWEPDPDGSGRFAAVDGVNITESADPSDSAMIGSLVGRAIPRSRNPVTLR